MVMRIGVIVFFSVLMILTRAEQEEFHNIDRKDILVNGSTITTTYFERQPHAQDQNQGEIHPQDVLKKVSTKTERFFEPEKSFKSDETEYPLSTLTPCLEVTSKLLSNFFSALWNGLKCVWGIFSLPFRQG